MTTMARQDLILEMLRNLQSQIATNDKKTDRLIEAQEKHDSKLAVVAEKVRSIEVQTKKTNGRVTKLEDKNHLLESKVGRKPTYISSRLIYLIAAILFMLLLILAKLLHIDAGWIGL